MLALASLGSRQAAAQPRPRDGQRTPAPAEKLGLISLPPTLRAAIALALEPWRIHVIELDDVAPPSSVPEAAAAARVIAVARSVDAVTWVTRTTESRTLWLYDLRDEQLVLRPIHGDPEDEAAAAALALTLKTLLRSSTIAPPEEQRGSRTPSPESPPPRRFWFEAEGGVRLATIGNRAIAPRIGLSFAYWPAAAAGHAGAVLRVEDGLGFSVRTSEFQGRLADHDLGIGLRGNVPLGDGVRLEPGLGGTLHLTTLDGAPIDGRATSLTRVDPSIDLGMALAVPLGKGFEAGVRLNAAFWTRWQRYELGGGTYFDVSPIQLTASLFLGAGLH